MYPNSVFEVRKMEVSVGAGPAQQRPSRCEKDALLLPSSPRTTAMVGPERRAERGEQPTHTSNLQASARQGKARQVQPAGIVSLTSWPFARHSPRTLSDTS